MGPRFTLGNWKSDCALLTQHLSFHSTYLMLQAFALKQSPFPC
jgi:hypothetical protein